MWRCAGGRFACAGAHSARGSAWHTFQRSRCPDVFHSLSCAELCCSVAEFHGICVGYCAGARFACAYARYAHAAARRTSQRSHCQSITCSFPVAKFCCTVAALRFTGVERCGAVERFACACAPCARASACFARASVCQTFQRWQCRSFLPSPIRLRYCASARFACACARFARASAYLPYHRLGLPCGALWRSMRRDVLMHRHGAWRCPAAFRR